MSIKNPETGLDQQSLNKEQVLAELKSAVNIHAQVAIYSKYVDKYGLDLLLSLIPVAGDIGSSAISLPYLLFQAKRAKLDMNSIKRIIGLQVADAAAGSVPVPLINSAADYAFKANTWSVPLFEAKILEISNKARIAGASEAEIKAIVDAGKNIIEGKKVITTILGRALKK